MAKIRETDEYIQLKKFVSVNRKYISANDVIRFIPDDEKRKPSARGVNACLRGEFVSERILIAAKKAIEARKEVLKLQYS